MSHLPETRSDLRKVKDLSVDDFRDIVRDEIKAAVAGLESRITAVESQIAQVMELGTKVTALETAATSMSQQLEDLEMTSLPKFAEHVEQIATSLALRNLDLEVHRRKWNLTIHGIPGDPGENEAATREACVKLAKDHLRVADAASSDFAACHRLSQGRNAGIILRFCDLSKRNQWLAGARHLKAHPQKVSLSPDLPPVLRPLKTELLNARKALPLEQKSKTSIRFLPQWPYVEMATSGGGPRKQPTISKKQIVDAVLGFNVLFQDIN